MTLFNTLLPLVLLATSPLAANAALYTSSSQLPKLSYDFVIVGGGTAGSVMAARLSENPNYQVLVLEAGGSDIGLLAATAPLLGVTLTPSTPYDWNYTLTAQPELDGRVLLYPRGKILGGTSTVNYMCYTRGPADDFNKYAEITGDPGWRWDHLTSYIPRHERVVPPTDGRGMDGLYDPSVHGTTGALVVNPISNHMTKTDQYAIEASRELGGDFALNLDLNGGKILGMNYSPSVTGGGLRSSASTAYLHPNIDRPNLHVLVNAQVTKLITTGKRNGLPHFNRVQFQSDPSAPYVTVQAKSEIILSAGSIGTPLLLQLSGIGDPEDLTPLGISTITNLPSVGKNLTDHPLYALSYRVKGETYDSLFTSPDAFQAALMEWETHKTGPVSSSFINLVGWLRLPSDHSIFDTVPDPSSGPGAAHFEVMPVHLFKSTTDVTPPPGNYMSIGAALTTTTSRGTVKISSSDPSSPPLINPNYLSTEFDKVVLRESVKAVQRFMSASAWKDWIEAPFGDAANLTDDEKIDAFIKRTLISEFHPSGTAATSPRGADWGVVDPDLKVKGVDGLRIVDASVFSFVPSAHPQGPVYLIAERAADLVAASFKETMQRDEL